MRGTLRRRLLALFFLVALLPSLGLTFFVTQYLARSLAALRNPETERALSASLHVIQDGIERLADDARQHADVLALDEDAGARLMAGDVAGVERRLRLRARDLGLDYLCLYRVAPSVERVFAARLGPRITIPEPEANSLREALSAGGLVTGEDVPRQVSGVAGIGDSHALLVGYQLDPEISAEIEALQKNLSMYRRLGVYTWLSQRSLWLFALLWSLVLGVVSFALAYLVSRSVTQPVDELSRAMGELAGGDPARRVKPAGTTEVRFLGHVFNRMAEELQESRRALIRAERLAAWREVARAVAHEIRNPLTPIQFALQRLREEAKRPEGPSPVAVSESAESILREVHSLREFATAFSAVAQLPDPNLQPCDLRPLIEDAAKLYRGSTTTEFRVEAGDGLPVAWADPAQMQRVLVNLIKNALEAMDGKGTVSLRLRRDPESPERALLLEVEDTGPGMDPAAVERAAHPGFTTKATGSGLGLTLVQRVVEQHGGRFGLDSAPGAGTRAWVSVPIHADNKEAG